jgi:hypothetical protein
MIATNQDKMEDTEVDMRDSATKVIEHIGDAVLERLRVGVHTDKVMKNASAEGPKRMINYLLRHAIYGDKFEYDCEQIRGFHKSTEINLAQFEAFKSTLAMVMVDLHMKPELIKKVTEAFDMYMEDVVTLRQVNHTTTREENKKKGCQVM